MEERLCLARAVLSGPRSHPTALNTRGGAPVRVGGDVLTAVPDVRQRKEHNDQDVERR
jgi:hypothetical protein